MLHANARNTDPSTSWLAGEAIEASGTAHAQREVALKAVKSHPGLTSKELSNITGLDRYMLARRLPEITGITQGEKRVCKVSGRQCVTWIVK